MTDSTISLEQQEKFKKLFVQFPSLMWSPGFVNPKKKCFFGQEQWFDPRRLNTWGKLAEKPHRLAVQFILKVWDAQAYWDIGDFDFWEAIRTWDQADRNGLISWIYEPFFIHDIR